MCEVLTIYDVAVARHDISGLDASPAEQDDMIEIFVRTFEPQTISPPAAGEE